MLFVVLEVQCLIRDFSGLFVYNGFVPSYYGVERDVVKSRLRRTFPLWPTIVLLVDRLLLIFALPLKCRGAATCLLERQTPCGAATSELVLRGVAAPSARFNSKK